MRYRTGIGYDIHRLKRGRRLVLGGVEIPYHKGLAGHSDADALAHAVIDALLGAAGLGDIGGHFPDTDKRYKGISSMKLLKSVCALLKKAGRKIVNVDTIIICQAPKLTGFKKTIRLRLARALGAKAQAVNVKAKTNEGLGEIGKGQAVACYAAVLLS
jgi:2-C-methyl-D-erythritol 2,4-cyclodiphosphate synthase